MMQRLLKLYAVHQFGKSHKTIRRYIKARRDAAAARVEFIERVFPAWKKKKWKDYRFGPLTSSQWGVRPPHDRAGFCFVMPPEWRPTRWSYWYRPSKKNKASRELGVEMQSPMYVAPNISELCDWLGIAERNGSVEIVAINSRRFVLVCHHSITPPSDCVRISDIQFEALWAKRRKAVEA